MALQQRSTGRRIAQLRERAHLTQEVAADKAGVTLRAYQKWEAGGGIQFANLQKLADALRVNVEEITGEAEIPNPFRLSDQMDGGFDEFRDHVANLNTQLAAIRSELQTATDERQDLHDQIERVNELLERQSTVLANIEKVVAVLSDAEVIERSAAAAVRSLPEWPAPPPTPVEDAHYATARISASRSRRDARRPGRCHPGSRTKRLGIRY